MGVFLALVLPVAVALVAGAVAFGGRALRPLAIAAFALAICAVSMVLGSAV